MYEHAHDQPLTADEQTTWAVYRALSSPSVERFGLQREALELLGVQRLQRHEARKLIADLDEILVGVDEAREELRPRGAKR